VVRMKRSKTMTTETMMVLKLKSKRLRSKATMEVCQMILRMKKCLMATLKKKKFKTMMSLSQMKR
jgi:hypothetical protein